METTYSNDDDDDDGTDPLGALPRGCRFFVEASRKLVPGRSLRRETSC